MTPTKPTKDDARRGVAALLLAFFKDRRLWASALVVLALGFLAYQLRAASKRAEDRQQLEKVKGMMAEATPKGSVLDMVKMMAKRDPAQEDEARQKQQAIREEATKLSPESRRELMQGQVKLMTGLTRQVLKMPPSQRNAVVDIFIDTMEAGRKRMEQAAQQNANSNDGNGGATRRRAMTDEDRDKARRGFFDSMSAEDRSTMIEGMRLMNDRRRERGLPPMPAFGGRRPEGPRAQS